MLNVPLKTVVAHCDRILRTKEIHDYDGAANGLQVENAGAVTRIAAAVDASLATLKLAVAAGADLLIVHHGLFWSPSHPWTGKKYENLASIVDSLFRQLSKNFDSSLDKLLAPLVRRSLRVFIVVIGVMSIADSVFNMNIGTWLAGLGIVGLAVSLAAQDSLKPVRLDHDYSGPDVQNRRPHSLFRLRRGDRGHRFPLDEGPHGRRAPDQHPQREHRQQPHRKYRTAPRSGGILRFRWRSTPPPKRSRRPCISFATCCAEEPIRGPIRPVHGEARPPRQVFFGDYAPGSLTLSVTYWYAPPVAAEFHAHAEKLNLRILEEFNRAGIA